MDEEGTLTFTDSIGDNSFEPQWFEFQNNGEMIFRIHFDGRIERGLNFTEDEASLKFWELLSEAYGIFKGNIERKIAAHITARMKTVSPSLSAAQALDDLRMAVESGDYEVTS